MTAEVRQSCPGLVHTHPRPMALADAARTAAALLTTGLTAPLDGPQLTEAIEDLLPPGSCSGCCHMVILALLIQVRTMLVDPDEAIDAFRAVQQQLATRDS